MVQTKKKMNDELYLVYVKPFSKKEYDLFFSETPDVVWGVDWDVKVPNTLGDLTPESSTYSKIVKIWSPYELTTIEDTSCYSMEYAINKIVALSWINISILDEYPEQGRCVLHFGDSFKKVQETLSKIGINI